MKAILFAFFLGCILGLSGVALAQEQPKPPTTEQQCQNLLTAFGAVQISAQQAKLASDVQTGIAALCRRLLLAEAPKPTPTPIIGEVEQEK